MEYPLQHPRTKSLLNILFVRCKFFMCKIQEGDELLDHIKKVKTLVDRPACLEIPMRNEYVVMTLFKRLSHSFEHLIMALETMLMMDLTMEYVTVYLHEMLKRKEREPEGDDVALVLLQGKAGNLSWRKDVKTCYYCGKLGHIAHFATMQRTKIKKIKKTRKNDDDYVFLTQHEAHLEVMCKCIMDLGPSK